jgi:formylglycine-generating enzyme required for sulfatase activity
VVPRIIADEARFFRVIGPTATTITAFTPNGYITWTNARIGTNYTVQTARSLGAATNWVDYIQVPVSNNVITHRLYDPNPPFGMALIPAGSFTMGDCMDDGDFFALPLHTVYVSAFYMDKYLVTKSLWDTVYQWATTNGYTFDNVGSGTATTHPVQMIDWYDCVKWCNARSEKEGKTPAYYTDAGLSVRYRLGQVAPYVNWSSGYRLPTEAEWEKAARDGASGQRFPWGNTISWSQANYWASPGTYIYDVNPTNGCNSAWTNGPAHTSPVGSFAATGYGLYDMAGNVWQWCWDWDGSYSSSSQTDPRGPASGTFRAFRGGCWHDSAYYCRAAGRYYQGPTYCHFILGFRSVLPAGQP